MAKHADSTSKCKYPHPLGKVKSVVHKNMPQKNPPPEKQNDT